MARAISIKVQGLKEVDKLLKKSKKVTKKNSELGIAKAAIFVQGEVKMSIAGQRAEFKSVDTGRFLNSVDVRIGKSDAVVFSGLPYARKLEFGTNFKNSPRKHFRNTKSRSKGKIREIIQKQVNKI